MTDPVTQVLYVLSWLVLVFFLQLSLWPSVRGTFPGFACAVSFPLSALLFSLSSWYCGLLRLPVTLALVPFAALFLLSAWGKKYSREILREGWPYLAVFAIFFSSMLCVRFANPSISYAEKFMDHAFLASVMRTPVVPPLDPWFAGGFLDVYYYLGYWMFGVMGIASGVPSHVAFNLVLPTVFGYSAVVLYALGRLLAPRFPWVLPAVLILPNPSFFWQVIQGKAAGSVLWDSTRTISNTINEYPLFSFLWGDVHPHVVGIFNQVLLVFLLVYTLQRYGDLGVGSRIILVLTSGLSLGSMPPTNTWDVLVYAPATVVFGILVGVASRGSPPPGNPPATLNATRIPIAGAVRECAGRIFLSPWSFLFSVPVVAGIAYLPFISQMRSQGIMGVGLVHSPTAPPEFLLVHGFFLLPMVLFFAPQIRRMPLLLAVPVSLALAGYVSAAIAAVPLAGALAGIVSGERRGAGEVLAALGLAIVIACEVVYLKDNMGDAYYRMNTVFKLYIAAWILMGASSLSMLSGAIGRHVPEGRVPQWARNLALVAVSVLLVAAPLAVSLDPPYKGGTLDGLAYLDSAHPGDARAIAFLRSLPHVGGIVEAEGGDYTYFGRVSAFTGIPTIIGWPFHEYMWRGNEGGWYGTRQADVRAIYEDPASTATLMRKYNVTHVYVGEPERERYAVRLGDAGLPAVYDRDGVSIYALE
ncbi:MAG: DUF2298 domain-containing protein [Methanolinea sp.]|nr:DUF2298 domain-containing protein [Methanolinea sp.]